MILTEMALTESRSARSATVDRVDVLDKVKALAMLPDGLHVTTEAVASYFEVDAEAIKSIVRRHREELADNGMRTVRGDDLRELKRTTEGLGDPLSERANALTLFTRRAVLNVGQLLTESDVARRVRGYLLDVEESATPAQRLAAVDKAEITKAQLEAIGTARQFGLTNDSYLDGVARTLIARMTGDEPELDPSTITITCDEYLADKDVSRKDLPSARTRLGSAVARLYREKYARDPEKRLRYVDGRHLPVSVYTRRDLDLFDAAWVGIRVRYGDGAH